MGRKGFTLIELVVVMAIIAILILIIVAAIQTARRTMTETTNKSNARTVMIALDNLKAKKGKFCDDLGDPNFHTDCAPVLEVSCTDLAAQLQDDGMLSGPLPVSATAYAGIPNNYCILNPLKTTGYALRVYDYSGTRLIQYFDNR